jgi:predicted NBD/HSP70 family sugar kinase
MYWGIDLGGTKIEGIVLKEADTDSVVARHRIDTQGEGGYDHVLSRIDTVVDELERLSGAKLTRLGMGTPGTLDFSSHC